MTDPTREVLYGPIGNNTYGNAGLVFITRAGLQRLEQIQDAIDNAKTWGEFFRALPEDEVAYARDRLEWQEIVVRDEEPFIPDHVLDPPDSDYQYPNTQAFDMRWMPPEVQALGIVEWQFDKLEFSAEREAEIVAALEAAGYTVRRDEDAFFGVLMWSPPHVLDYRWPPLVQSSSKDEQDAGEGSDEE